MGEGATLCMPGRAAGVQTVRPRLGLDPELADGGPARKARARLEAVLDSVTRFAPTGNHPAARILGAQDRGGMRVLNVDLNADQREFVKGLVPAAVRA